MAPVLLLSLCACAQKLLMSLYESLADGIIDVEQRRGHQAGATQSPERPPDFFSRRTPPMVMPRSSALAMS